MSKVAGSEWFPTLPQFCCCYVLCLIVGGWGIGVKGAGLIFQNSEKWRFPPFRPPKHRSNVHTHAHTHTHTHTHTHARTHTDTHTFKIWKEHFLCIFSQSNVCGLLKSSQQLFIICYRFFVFYDPYIPTYCIRAERLIKTLPNLSRKR